MCNRSSRSGFTLLELLVVLALVVLLGAASLPSLSGLKGNANQKTATDQLRSRIADARGLAMQESTAYRLAVHRDGTKIRLAPDSQEFAQVPASDVATATAKAIETTLDKATITISADSEAGADQDDWITIGTFLPNGTCREDSTLVEVHEGNFPAMKILLRGVTGTARLVLPDSSANGGSPK